MSFIYCQLCLSNGKQNKCYITGFNNKCNHDNGWAYTNHLSGKTVLNCSTCPGNNCYITGFEIKCGHNNGLAYSIEKSSISATCATCNKDLKGYWSMESNTANAPYQNCSYGRYLGILDGYFLYGGSSNWVYSYCRVCWIKQIKSIIPSIGFSDQFIINENNQLNIENIKLKNELIRLKSVDNPNNTFTIESNNDFKIESNKFNNNLTKIENNFNSYFNEINLLQEKVSEILKINYENSEEIIKLESMQSEMDSHFKSMRNNYENLRKLSEIDEQNQNLIKSKINGLEESISQLNIQPYESIAKNIYDEKGFDNIGNLLKSTEIKEFSPILNSIDYDGFLNNVKKNILPIIIKITSDLRNNIHELVNVSYENIDKKIFLTEEKVKKLKEDLKILEMPDEIIQNSVSLLDNYICDLKKKKNILKIVKEKIIN